MWACPTRSSNDAGSGSGKGCAHGFDVVVHCKGGLGRAGLTAARLQIELGWETDNAIAAVRAARPGAIETAAQQAFLGQCRSIAEAQPEQTPAAILDRAQGALLGLAVGDALSTTLEFTRRDHNPRLTGMIGGGPFRLQPGQWTDGTAMALALADSLVTTPAFDAHDCMRRFVDWYQSGRYSCTGRCFDIGVTTRAALARFEPAVIQWPGTRTPAPRSTAR